jgi:hypothetical protein
VTVRVPAATFLAEKQEVKVTVGRMSTVRVALKPAA